jgi:K+:H+ antiporter
LPSSSPKSAYARRAGVADVRTLIFSTPGIENLAAVIRMARELNPAVQVLARATYLCEQPDLFAAGADTVFTAESEIALAFSIEILRRVGATPEQIDRERSRRTRRADRSDERQRRGGLRAATPPSA